MFILCALALLIHTLSCNGKISMAINGDKRLFPTKDSITRLLDSIVAEFDEMASLHIPGDLKLTGTYRKSLSGEFQC